MKALKWVKIVMMISFILLSACTSQPANQASQQANASKAAEPTKNQNMPQEIRIGFQVIPNAELLAKALGLYQKNFKDVKVSLRQFESARDVNTAMTAGSIDIGLIGSSSVATGVAQKLPYQVIWLHDVIGDNEALVVKKASNIKSVKDTVGKKIAVPFGSTTHYSFLSALRENNINPNDVKILDMQPQDMFAAFKQGHIDGGYVWTPILDKMIKEDGEVILTSRQLSEEGIVTADVCVASKKFIESYPDAITTYIKTLDESVKLYRTKQDVAVKAMAKELNVSDDEAKLAMSQLVWLDASEQAGSKNLGTPGKIGEFSNALKKTGEFMVTQKTISSAPDLNVYKEAIQAQFVVKVKDMK